MIQRIQTLYLLIAGILVAILYFAPLAEFSGKTGELYLFNLTGVVPEGTTKSAVVQESWPLFILTSLILILEVLTIFQFKNRPLQIKLSNLSVFLLLGLTAATYFYIWKTNGLIGGGYTMKLYFTFPLISMIFVFLAARAISKDEQLVKSIDRIR
jgi:hypothetical protein